MRRFRKRFKRPKRPYDSEQLAEGKKLQQTYGLRRKKEIWIAQNVLRGYRQRARQLIAASDEEKENVLITSLRKLGLLKDDANLDDVLGLNVDGILGRRLESIVHKLGMAKTPLQARQSIVHGHVSVNGKRMPFPSYIVKADEERSITSTFTPPTPPKATAPQIEREGE